MTPSVKAIEEGLKDVLQKEYSDNSHAIAKAIYLLLTTATTHKLIDNALDIINEIIRGYGVESIGDNECYSYYCNIGLLYVNQGDTYTTTVIYDTREEQFIIGSWGDIVESQPDRFNEDNH